MTIREQLHQHIATLPDDVIEEVADFTLFVMSRRQVAPSYVDWGSAEWQEFALAQFFREEDEEIEYTLEDAEETYHP